MAKKKVPAPAKKKKPATPPQKAPPPAAAKSRSAPQPKPRPAPPRAAPVVVDTVEARRTKMRQIRRRSPRIALALLDQLGKRFKRRDWKTFGLDPEPVYNWIDDASEVIAKYREERPRGFRVVTTWQQGDAVKILPHAVKHYVDEVVGIGSDELNELEVINMASREKNGRTEHRVKVRVSTNDGPTFMVVRAAHLAPARDDGPEEEPGIEEEDTDDAEDDDELDEDSEEDEDEDE